MILAVGLNHKTAPLAIRERLAFDTSRTLSVLAELRSCWPGAEFVLLSTCNRVELYWTANQSDAPSVDEILALIGRHRSVAVSVFRPYIYVHRQEGAVRHLLTVASSLDSMVIGETEILGQVKQSHRIAVSAGAAGSALNRLFNLAAAAGRKVHSQTLLSSSRASVPGLAVQLLARTVPDKTAHLLVLGAGEMGELLVRLLVEAGYRNVTVSNRSMRRSLDVANRYGVETAPWDSLVKQLCLCRVAIASTAATEYIVSRHDMAEHMAGRCDDMLVIDLGVPRNFDPAMAELPGIRLYSVDDLSPLLCEQPGLRSDDIARGFDIIYRSSAEFMHWFASRDLGPLIGRMRRKFSDIATDELNAFLIRPHDEMPLREDIGLMLSRIVGKLSHCVIEHVDSINR
ncbi:MAG TPA: glutamyl-tRNA reductase, partial [Sedimentisphaerales bacterium]|nr:glutamyl-tRNA reductase [Sedimentisphaerales bacterium]